MHSLAKSFVMIINEYFNLMILLLDIGTVCDFRLSYGRVLNKKSKIIAVNRNKSQLFKVSHTVAAVGHAICETNLVKKHQTKI